MKKMIITFISACLLLLSLSGCTNEKATITTTVYPVKYLIEQLAGDKVNVEYISSDDFIQRASIVSNYHDILENTTLFVYINSLEPYLDIYGNILDEYQFDIINLASLSAVYDFKRYNANTIDDEIIYKETEYYQSELFEDVDKYEKDPFIWLDPIAASSIVSTIKDWLQERYPEDALVFENNFKSLQASLVRLDAEYQTLNEIDDIKLVTVAPTFGNWQKSYGIEVYPLIISKYGVLPSDEQLAFIEAKIKSDGVKYIVYDETLSDDMLELYEEVKKDLNLTEIKLSSLSHLSANDIEKGKDYMTIMVENLSSLEKIFK